MVNGSTLVATNHQRGSHTRPVPRPQRCPYGAQAGTEASAPLGYPPPLRANYIYIYIYIIVWLYNTNIHQVRFIIYMYSSIYIRRKPYPETNSKAIFVAFLVMGEGSDRPPHGVQGSVLDS